VIGRLARIGLLSDDGKSIKDILTARVVSEFAKRMKSDAPRR